MSTTNTVDTPQNDNNATDARAMDAADTLVALANTPTNEFKSTSFFNSLSSSPLSPPPSEHQQQQNNKIEIILNNEIISLQRPQISDNVESACKLILQQVLKVGNLQSITIKTTATADSTDNTSHTINLMKPTSTTFNNLSTSQAKKTKKFKHINELTDEPIENITTIQQIKHEPVILPNETNLDEMNNNSSDDDSDLESVSSSVDAMRILSGNKNAYLSSVRPAPTLATGRRSKDVELPPEESKKRQERRERNKEAAARCRRKREDLASRLTQQADILKQQQDILKRKYQEMLNEKKRLENLLETHETQCKLTQTSDQLSQPQQLIRIKKEDINEIIKQSSERKKSENKMNKNNLVSFRSQLSKDLLSNLHLTQLLQNNQNSLFDDSTRVLTPLSASEQSWAQQKQIINEAFSPTSLNSSQSSSSSVTSTTALMQRPNNLSLKPSVISSQQQSPLSKDNNSNEQQNYQNQMQNLMQNIAYAISSQKSYSNTNNNNNISLLMTPTIQMNTPTLLALTPFEQHFFAAAVAAANTPMSHLSHQLNQFNSQQQQQNQETSNQDSLKYIG